MWVVMLLRLYLGDEMRLAIRYWLPNDLEESILEEMENETKKNTTQHMQIRPFRDPKNVASLSISAGLLANPKRFIVLLGCEYEHASVVDGGIAPRLA